MGPRGRSFHGSDQQERGNGGMTTSKICRHSHESLDGPLGIRHIGPGQGHGEFVGQQLDQPVRQVILVSNMPVQRH